MRAREKKRETEKETPYSVRLSTILIAQLFSKEEEAVPVFHKTHFSIK